MCKIELCGDGVVNNDGAEDCEPPGTSLCADDCTLRQPLCGDGYQTPPEQCEDGNLFDGDGCTSACVLELCGDGVVNNDHAEDCEPPGTALCTDACAVRAPICGDRYLTPPEQCEDGNLENGDGCSSACLVEALPFCGDGALDEGEECDDGNLANGDGCSSMCKTESSPMPDAGVPMPDAGVPMPDAGMETDSGVPTQDGGIQTSGALDGGNPGPDSTGGTVTGGCSMRTGETPFDAAPLLGLLGLALARRRTRSRASLLEHASLGGSRSICQATLMIAGSRTK